MNREICLQNAFMEAPAGRSRLHVCGCLCLMAAIALMLRAGETPTVGGNGTVRLHLPSA